MTFKKLLAVSMVALAPACTNPPEQEPPPGDGPDVDEPTFDQALLAEYKRALPTSSVLPEAKNPARDVVANPNMAIGDLAEYPQHAVPVIEGINAHIGAIIHGLDEVTDLPPTAYNSDTLEFVWGPFDDAESDVEGDKILVYIKDQGEGHAFRYVYALARGVGNDVATYVPVILGGANPDAEEEDHGNGVTLWDLEANRAFMEENYPDAGEVRTGRFAAMYSRDRGEDGNVLTVVLASIRGFSEDGVARGDLDHLWGHVENDDAPEVAFVHIQTAADLDATTDAKEDLSLRIAHVENVGGRGEAIASGGDYGDASGEGVECFDGAIQRTYFDVTHVAADGTRTSLNMTEGASTDCGVFDATLDALEVPSLDTVDPELVAVVQNIATNGFPQE